MVLINVIDLNVENNLKNIFTYSPINIELINVNCLILNKLRC